jgi:ABC-type transport system involved in multi-copper enzyme maturation permease subunit
MMLPPLNLWRAEWMKTARRPFNQILLVSVLALQTVFFMGAPVVALVHPDRFLSNISQVLPYPHNLAQIAQTGAIVGQLLAAIFVANAVGSEYTGSTWKMILPRYGSRAAFLLSKAGIGLTAIGLLLALLLLLGVPTSLLGAALLGLAPTEPLSPGGVALRLLEVWSAAFPMLLYGSAALFTTVATRSALAGAMLSFFGLQTVAMLEPFYGRLALLMPYPHLPNIIERWVFHDPVILSRIDASFGSPISPWISIAVVLAYSAVFTVGAFALFDRQDLAGE